LTGDGFEKGAQLRNSVIDKNIFTDLKNETLENSDFALEINNLNFSYKKGREIFSSYSLKIKRGGIISITGKNGRGKTTLAKILTGILKPSEGEIKIDGVPRRSKELRNFCTLVTQASDHQLYMKSVIDEIGLAQKRVKSKIIFTPKKLLEMFNLQTLKDRHPQTLSGGEKQRLTIMCSIAIKPQILILDEPTSGLDGKNLNRLVDILKKLAKKGVTILLITHDAELISNCCTGNINLDDLN
jgi:energy-coupling factor transport system ATP-binding protein